MEKCFNCGAAVRPGAKFCTSCGTRLIENPAPAPEATAWGQSTSPDETQVATPAAEPATTNGTTATTGDDADDSAPFAAWKHPSSGWNTQGDTSPADRFEAALGSDERPAPTPTSWGSPPASDTDEDRFASWAAAYGTTPAGESASPAAPTPASDENADAEEEAVTAHVAPDATSAETSTTDAAGFSEGDERQVDYLSGDESISTGGPDSGIAAGTPSDTSDTRQRASALVDELRSLIWSIGEASPATTGDTTHIRNMLSSVRGQTPDFSDLEATIADVRESPKDIDALRELGSEAGRLELLLESHARLTAAIDDAIRKLR